MLKKYSLYCNTEALTVETDFRENVPAACPHNNQHSIDPDSISVIAQTAELDANIKSSAVVLPSQEKGFQDLTGHNIYRFGPLMYEAQAGKVNVFYEKFSSLMYLCGGGVSVPEFNYVNGEVVTNKPEKGDYAGFALVDIDNVLGYGKTATISNIARSSNIATVTTSASHTFSVGELLCINADDNSFDDMEESVLSVPDSTHFTYANIGEDVEEKDATGSVGKIITLGVFVPKCYVWPNQKWECLCSDAKPLPSGIYLSFRYVSVGSTNVTVCPFYSLRT